MIVSDLLNATGILVLMFGGCMGMIGSFSEKNKDIVRRTGNTFGNIEHYKSMISQKYFNIFSFFFITVGSFFLLLTYLLNKKFLLTNVPKSYLILSIIILILVGIYLFYIKWITYKVDQITVSNQVKLFTNKADKNIDDYNLKLVIDILKQRRVKTDYNDTEQILDVAKMYFKIKK